MAADGLKTAEAMGMAFLPESRMMLIPPLPVGVATAAMVESSMTRTAPEWEGRHQPNFFWV